jgi:hypothetical protein
MINDTVCLKAIKGKNMESCVEHFPFMAISEEKGLNEGIDGILGLGPNHENGPSYLLALRYN